MESHHNVPVDHLAPVQDVHGNLLGVHHNVPLVVTAAATYADHEMTTGILKRFTLPSPTLLLNNPNS